MNVKFVNTDDRTGLPDRIADLFSRYEVAAVCCSFAACRELLLLFDGLSRGPLDCFLSHDLGHRERGRASREREREREGG